MRRGEDKTEIRMGIHGEPGVRRGMPEPADKITNTFVETILDDMPRGTGNWVSVLGNNVGGTPREELDVMCRRVHKLLKGRGVTIECPHVGKYATSMGMTGTSVSIRKLDDELVPLLDAPAMIPFAVQGRPMRIIISSAELVKVLEKMADDLEAANNQQKADMLK
jgi:dihydroxyacetone kinase